MDPARISEFKIYLKVEISQEDLKSVEIAAWEQWRVDWEGGREVDREPLHKTAIPKLLAFVWTFLRHKAGSAIPSTVAEFLRENLKQLRIPNPVGKARRGNPGVRQLFGEDESRRCRVSAVFSDESLVIKNAILEANAIQVFIQVNNAREFKSASGEEVLWITRRFNPITAKCIAAKAANDEENPWNQPVGHTEMAESDLHLRVDGTETQAAEVDIDAIPQTQDVADAGPSESCLVCETTNERDLSATGALHREPDHAEDLDSGGLELESKLHQIEQIVTADKEQSLYKSTSVATVAEEPRECSLATEPTAKHAEQRSRKLTITLGSAGLVFTLLALMWLRWGLIKPVVHNAASDAQEVVRLTASGTQDLVLSSGFSQTDTEFSSQSALSHGFGQLETFWRTFSGEVMWRTHDATGWKPTQSLRGVSNSAIACVALSDDRLLICYCGPDNALKINTRVAGKWLGERDLGGSITLAPSVVSWGGSRVDIIYVANNRLYSAWTSDLSTWSVQGDLEGNAVSQPSAVTWGTGQMTVAYVGPGRTLRIKTLGPSGWLPEQILAGSASTAPKLVSWEQGRLDLIYGGIDGRLKQQWINPGLPWSGENDLGGSVRPGSAPGVVTWGIGELQVVYASKDNRLKRQWLDEAGWHGEQDLGVKTSTAVSLLSWEPGRLDALFFSAGSLRQAWTNPGLGWSIPEPE